MSTIVIKFDNAVDVQRIDLTRIGVVCGTSHNRLAWFVEPQIEGWDALGDPSVSYQSDVAREILRSGLAAAGVFTEVLTRDQYEAAHA